MSFKHGFSSTGQISSTFLLSDMLPNNLHTSNTMFMFKILQNANDNNYNTSLSDGQEPYVPFEVGSDVVFIVCNVNGLMNENLEAVCAVGEIS